MILRRLNVLVATAIGSCVLIALGACQRETREATLHTPTTITPAPLPGQQLPSETVKDAKTLLAETAEALQSGDVRAAGKVIRTAVAIAPEDPQIGFMMAIVLGAEHRFPEAVRMLDKLAETVPETRLPALGQTAEWLVLQGHWRQAETRYRAVLDEVPDAAMAHRQLSQLLVRQGRRLDAAKHLNALCQQGNIEELELRTLLSLASPFAADIARDELEPIGPLGKTRFAISTGDWNQAATELLSRTSLTPTESALLGRIYAEQKDFAALEAWANDKSNPAPETADGWFGRGVLAAYHADHRGALNHFCEAILRDPTDEQAYARLAETLEQLSAFTEAAQAKQRAEWLARTDAIGNEMAASNRRDLDTLAELAQLLEKLHRPLESLSWHAVRIAYGRSTLPAQEQQSQLVEINRRRIELIENPAPAATKQFVLCDIDLESIATERD